jgi:hypothetical protein
MSDDRPLRIVACLDRPPARMRSVVTQAAKQAAETGVPLHLMALVRTVDPSCGCKFRGEDSALAQAVEEQVTQELRDTVRELPPGTTWELVTGHSLRALESRSGAGDLLVTRRSRRRHRPA